MNYNYGNDISSCKAAKMKIWPIPAMLLQHLKQITLYSNYKIIFVCRRFHNMMHAYINIRF